jgi:hypothetical protein
MFLKSKSRLSKTAFQKILFPFSNSIFLKQISSLCELRVFALAVKKKEAGHKPNSVDVIISLAKTVTGSVLLRSYPKAAFSELEKTGTDRPLAFLFDLAPDGVCLAAFIAEGAVGSYPAISPLPLEALRPQKAVYFLWHFPSPLAGRLGVTQHPVLWSSDFPHPRA